MPVPLVSEIWINAQRDEEQASFRTVAANLRGQVLLGQVISLDGLDSGYVDMVVEGAPSRVHLGTIPRSMLEGALGKTWRVHEDPVRGGYVLEEGTGEGSITESWIHFNHSQTSGTPTRNAGFVVGRGDEDPAYFWWDELRRKMWVFDGKTGRVGFPEPYKRSTGLATTDTTNKLIDDDLGGEATFVTDGVQAGDIAINTSDNTWAFVTSVDSETQLTLAWDAFPDGNESYVVQAALGFYHNLGETGAGDAVHVLEHIESGAGDRHRVYNFEKSMWEWGSGSTRYVGVDSGGVVLFPDKSLSWEPTNSGSPAPYISWWEGTLRSSGTADTYTFGKLIDTTATFQTDGVVAGDIAVNTDDYTIAEVVSVDSETQLTLDWDCFNDGDEAYEVRSLQELYITLHGTKGPGWLSIKDYDGTEKLKLDSEGRFFWPYPSVISSGTATTDSLGKLVDTGATFQTDGVKPGDIAFCTTALSPGDLDYYYQMALVQSVDSETQLSLTADIYPNGTEGYEIRRRTGIDVGERLGYGAADHEGILFTIRRGAFDHYTPAFMGWTTEASDTAIQMFVQLGNSDLTGRFEIRDDQGDIKHHFAADGGAWIGSYLYVGSDVVAEILRCNPNPVMWGDNDAGGGAWHSDASGTVDGVTNSLRLRIASGKNYAIALGDRLGVNSFFITDEFISAGDVGTVQFSVNSDGDTFIKGDLDHDGSQLGFFGAALQSQPAAYTITNGLADRTYDANSTTVAELADVLYTLIADLQAYGLLQ